MVLTFLSAIALANRIRHENTLETELKNLQAAAEQEKWKRASQFSLYCTFTGGISFGPDPVRDSMKSSIEPLELGGYNIECGENVISNLEKVIEIEDTCPYAYFHFAYCYKKINDPRWKESAIMAKEIFQNTISIPGYQSLHENGLKNVIDMLSETKE